jgi:phosphate-selective porin OprO/OprP
VLAVLIALAGFAHAEEKPAKPDFITANAKDGFTLQSGDGAFVLKLRGYLQADARLFSHDPPGNDGTEFLLRRVRPIFEGTLYRCYKFRIMPDFGGGSTVLQDAYAETAFGVPANARVGKYKAPVGLERLQSGTNLLFPERGLPTNLVPNRDIGLQFQGIFGEGLFEYAAGIFDGVADGGSTDGDVTDDSKEFAGRVFAHPLKNSDVSAFAGLGIGMAGTVGNQSGETGATLLGRYRTPGQATFFSYLAAALANGTHYRLAPQAYWYSGPFGLLGEYVRSSQEVSAGPADETIENTAWQVAASWIVTGEAASYNKGVTPTHNLDFGGGSFGAFELVARIGQLNVDDDAFPTFADPTVSADEAFSYGAGVNWYWNRAVKLSAAYDRTSFDDGAVNGDRPDEDVVITRVQLAF